MEYLLEYKAFRYKEGDLVLIHYWYSYDLTVVKIVGIIGNKFKVTHNIEESNIFNAPDEIIKQNEIIDYYKPINNDKKT